MEIHIKTIPHEKQDYRTVGNYKYDENGILQITVSSMDNEWYETLVAIHELLEERLTKKQGITEKIITDFDLMFEQERDSGLHSNNEEPGFDPRSPYLDAHMYATSVEMNFCNKLGINWSEYDKTVIGL
jgi:hypothetical protein